MANEAGNDATSIASTLLFGAIGAGLVYYGRRRNGVLATIVTTAGYGMITKAVSATVFAALAPSRT